MRKSVVKNNIVFMLLSVLLSFIVISESKADTREACQQRYRATAELTKSPDCCLKITVTNDVGCDIAIRIRTFTGSGSVIETVDIAEGVERDSSYVYTLCNLPEDEDVKWEVAYATDLPPWYYTFAEGSISKEDIKKCKKGELPTVSNCYDDPGCSEDNWEEHSDTIKLSEFPNCPIIYTYDARVCNDEYQIRKLRIELIWEYIYDCLDLIDWLLRDEDGNFIEGGLNFERLQALYLKSYRKVSDISFEDFVSQTEHKEIFDCNNPEYMRQGATVTFVRGACISYCGSYYYEDNKFKAEFKEDPCDEMVCCKVTRKYCLDFSDGAPKTVVTEEHELTDTFKCDPYNLPPQSCRTKDVIWNYRSPCLPTCDIPK